MENIKEKKKILLREFKQQAWPRQLKTWQLDKMLPLLKTDRIKLDEFKAGFVKMPKGVNFYFFKRAPLKLQKKFLQYYQAQGKLDKYLLATANNHFIVEIKATADKVIYWRNNFSTCQVVFFLITGQGKVEIIEEQKSNRLFVGQALVIESKPNSQVTYTLLAKKNKGLASLYYRAFIYDQAKFQWQAAINNKAGLTGHLETIGQASAGRSYQLVAGKFTDSSQTSLLIVNNHRAEHSSGDMIFKGLGEGKAWAWVEGIIEIGAKARYSNSYLQEDVLLLGKQAKVIAVPKLEILNNEVMASHGATIGKIDEQAMFYLMSRGLDQGQAKNLILTGFFKKVVDKISNEMVKRKFEKVLI